MNKILSIPEDQLEITIKIIRSGIKQLKNQVPKDTKEYLLEWCDDEEQYLKILNG
jgi:hypothetical protein